MLWMTSVWNGAFALYSSPMSTSERAAHRRNDCWTFLRSHDADTIYLVGDIVDGWALKSSWYWPQSHNDLVQKVLRKARKGVKVVYVPGNHDDFLRNYYGTHFGGIDVVENIIHVGS